MLPRRYLGRYDISGGFPLFLSWHSIHFLLQNEQGGEGGSKFTIIFIGINIFVNNMIKFLLGEHLKHSLVCDGPKKGETTRFGPSTIKIELTATSMMAPKFQLFYHFLSFMYHFIKRGCPQFEIICGQTKLSLSITATPCFHILKCISGMLASYEEAIFCILTNIHPFFILPIKRTNHDPSKQTT